MFLCSVCNKSFSTKQRFKSHLFKKNGTCSKQSNEPMKLLSIEHKPSSLKTKQPVKLSDFQVKTIDNDFKCKFCEKTFDRQFFLDRHLNSINTACYTIRTTVQKKPEINVINKNILTQILIARHGKERIDHITKEVMLSILNQPSFIKMFTDIACIMYFNKIVPENSNWCLVYPHNQKAGVAYNHDTAQFERKSTVDIIDEKFENMLNLLQPLIEEIYREDELYNILNYQQKKNIRHYYGAYGIMQISKDCPEIYEAIHNLSYNSRSIPMTSWKEQGLNGKYLSLKF